MRCDRQVVISVLIPSVFAAPIGQSFFQPAQLRHKHEIEVSDLATNSPFQGLKLLLKTETETTTQMYTEVEPQTETVYVTEVYTQVDENISGSLPTSSIGPTRSGPEHEETSSLAPVALPIPPEEKFSSDNGKFLGLFLAVIGVVALLATVFFMLHRYRALHRRATTNSKVASASSSASDSTMSDSHNEYLGGEELDRKQTSTTLLNGDSGDKSRARIVGTSEGLEETRVERPPVLEGQPPVALVGNGRITESPRPSSMIRLPPSAFKRESSPSPLRNMWRARSGFHTPVIRSPRIPVTQSMSNIEDQEQYDVQCRRCEKLWLARPLSREWPKSPWSH
jgi:hypothetical protein